MDHSAGTETPATSVSSDSVPAVSTEPWYKRRFPLPPTSSDVYKPKDALEDISGICYALELFLASHMVESEDYCHSKDPKKERLYFASGFGLIQCVKGLMSYEDEDLLAAIGHTKRGIQIASLHRKQQTLFGSRIVGFVASSLGATTNSGIVNFIKGMTPVERHAELVYAESSFQKALLGIVYSGDWLAFIKEALNLRNATTIYKHLGMYIDHMDALAAQASPEPAPNSTPRIDTTVDAHFRSGVYLGIGMCNIILSMMPGRLLTIVELFGYTGDRKYGLEMLMKAGGWTATSDEPLVGVEEEGVRRSICDMSLLIFHLVLSSFTFDGVDIGMATKILQWNLKRYPNGVFFLFGAGRLARCRSQPLEAIEYYTRAMESQSQYRNLHHISFWEISIARLALWDVKGSSEFWRELVKEATWSKCIYTYGLAVCLLEVGSDAEKIEAAKLLEQVPDLRQKIAGKSIPLEKYAGRKARKFHSQGALTLPALELAYIFHGIAHAPREVIIGKMLPEVQSTLQKLGEREKIEKKWNGGKGGYWDDYSLARFLEGVCLRYVAYPDLDAVVDSKEVLAIPKEVAEVGAAKAFAAVFEHGPKIELDHHLVYHAHYELGRLLACQSKHDEAKAQFELVLSGKPLEVGQSGKKGKYSMENSLHMRTHAAAEALQQKQL
ncbi:hypothetical protein BDN72DRAFT_774082 [Pluteus cervinus]|uniref:Uncharacterized protein n=1 Tax=Pluteus cervinus TaxID=181527 RepID=A0ACD3AGR7_9AGAR|nr:hypothetical protein BDN72DRAFT_774082 [Pluteus cervinus]